MKMIYLMRTKSKLVNKFLVSWDADKQEHITNIRFKLPLVDDKFVYNDLNNKSKGYKVLLLDSPIIGHLIQKLEGKKEKVSFSRVDGDTLENLIKKEEATVSKLSEKEKETLKPLIEDVVKEGGYTVQLEPLDSKSMPFVLTQPEFMRRMKEMQQTGGGGCCKFPAEFS